MAVTRRYQPSHPGGQRATYGIDLAPLLPPGVGITGVAPTVSINTVPRQPATDIAVKSFGSLGRLAWATIEGGTDGTDYVVRWFITDSVPDPNAWIIDTLLLCAATS